MHFKTRRFGTKEHDVDKAKKGQVSFRGANYVKKCWALGGHIKRAFYSGSRSSYWSKKQVAIRCPARFN